MKNHNKGARRGLLMLGVAVLVGLMMGCLSGCSLSSLDDDVKAKTFSEEGMTITLTDEFSSFDAGNFTVGFQSRNAMVLGLKEEFTLKEGFADYTLEEYGNLVLTNNKLEFCELNSAEGLTFFEYLYTDPDSAVDYRYFSCVYKTEDAFWLVHFITEEKSLGVYADQIVTWAKSVEFDS